MDAVSRLAGRVCVVNGAAQMGYASAKAAVVQLSRDLGVHLARSGVRVADMPAVLALEFEG